MRLTLSKGVLLSSAIVAALAAFSPPGPRVDLGYVTLVGNSTSPAGEVNSSVTFFGGIPYAQPPVGDLRFRAPRQLDEDTNSSTPFDARNWGAPCIQQAPSAVGIGSEDCLFLNVWKPSDAQNGDDLPVYVYIHGGGFYAGAPVEFPLFDWVKQHPNIIAVSMSYRLNLFGFLSGSAVAADGNINAGLLDQRAALEWVQRHIGSFGGDPKKITIGGESAGGASVLMHVVSFGGTRELPFQAVSAQSIGYGPMPSAEMAQVVFENVTNVVGCDASENDVMSCLRSVPTKALVAAINHIQQDFLSPVVEGPSGYLPQSPSQLLRSGNFSKLDALILGHTTNDGRTFAGGPPDAFKTEQDIIDRAMKGRYPGLTNETMQKALKIYPAPNATGSPFATQYDRAWTIAQDIVFGCADWLLADKMANKSVENIFKFRFNAPNSVLFNANPYLGAMHTSDIFFMFDGTNSLPNAANSFHAFNSSEAVLSREVISYWSSFTSNGAPSSNGSIDWPSYIEGNQRIVLSRGVDGDTRTNTTVEDFPEFEAKRCMFWMAENVTEETSI